MRKAEKAWLDRLSAAGCIVCRREHGAYTPAQIHHLRTGRGTGQRSPHFLAIPLCPDHHQSGGPGVAYHASPKLFEQMYGSELDLLAATLELVI